jgi:hypothetical protein
VHVGDAIVEVHSHLPRITADFAVFDVLLIASAAGVYADCCSLATIWTRDFRRRLDSSVAEWEFIVQLAVTHVRDR